MGHSGGRRLGPGVPVERGERWAGGAVTRTRGGGLACISRHVVRNAGQKPTRDGSPLKRAEELDGEAFVNRP